MQNLTASCGHVPYGTIQWQWPQGEKMESLYVFLASLVIAIASGIFIGGCAFFLAWGFKDSLKGLLPWRRLTRYEESSTSWKCLPEEEIKWGDIEQLLDMLSAFLVVARPKGSYPEILRSLLEVATKQYADLGLDESFSHPFPLCENTDDHEYTREIDAFMKAQEPAHVIVDLKGNPLERTLLVWRIKHHTSWLLEMYQRNPVQLPSDVDTAIQSLDTLITGDVKIDFNYIGKVDVARNLVAYSPRMLIINGFQFISCWNNDSDVEDRAIYNAFFTQNAAVLPVVEVMLPKPVRMSVATSWYQCDWGMQEYEQHLVHYVA